MPNENTPKVAPMIIPSTICKAWKHDGIFSMTHTPTTKSEPVINTMHFIIQFAVASVCRTIFNGRMRSMYKTPAIVFKLAETELRDALKTHDMKMPGIPIMWPTLSCTKRGTIWSTLSIIWKSMLNVFTSQVCMTSFGTYFGLKRIAAVIICIHCDAGD